MSKRKDKDSKKKDKNSVRSPRSSDKKPLTFATTGKDNLEFNKTGTSKTKTFKVQNKTATKGILSAEPLILLDSQASANAQASADLQTSVIVEHSSNNNQNLPIESELKQDMIKERIYAKIPINTKDFELNELSKDFKVTNERYNSSTTVSSIGGLNSPHKDLNRFDVLDSYNVEVEYPRKYPDLIEEEYKILDISEKVGCICGNVDCECGKPVSFAVPQIEEKSVRRETIKGCKCDTNACPCSGKLGYNFRSAEGLGVRNESTISRSLEDVIPSSLRKIPTTDEISYGKTRKPTNTQLKLDCFCRNPECLCTREIMTPEKRISLGTDMSEYKVLHKEANLKHLKSSLLLVVPEKFEQFFSDPCYDNKCHLVEAKSEGFLNKKDSLFDPVDDDDEEKYHVEVSSKKA